LPLEGQVRSGSGDRSLSYAETIGYLQSLSASPSYAIVLF
jgi:hypothetical protein